MSLWKPNNIVPASALIEESCISDVMRATMKELLDLGVRFYVVDSNCGRYYRMAKVLTIPLWLWSSAGISANLLKHGVEDNLKNRILYRAWYLSHEMAHAMNHVTHGNNDDVHGPKFMAELLRICPENAVHFELGYKPKNALAAGIMPVDF